MFRTKPLSESGRSHAHIHRVNIKIQDAFFFFFGKQIQDDFNTLQRNEQKPWQFFIIKIF